MNRYLLRGTNAGEVFLADAGLGWKWHVPAGQLANVVYAVGTGGGHIITPPGAQTTIVEGVAVWVADQKFVDAIPRTA